MSGCDRFRDLLQEDLDGRLGAEARSDLAAHVRSCAACTREAEGLRRVRAGLRAMGTVGAPPGFRDDVLGRMPASARIFRLPWFAVGAVAAAAVVVVAVTVARNDFSAPETARVAREQQKAPGALLDAREAVGAAADAEEEDGTRKKLGKSEAAGPPEGKADSWDAGGERSRGPVGEIPPDARVPADPAPPARPAPPVPEGAPAASAVPGAAAGPESDRDAAAPSAESPAAPRVRLVVFRSREAADRFVTALGDVTGREDAPPAPAERAAPAPATRARAADAAAADGASYREVARVGLRDEAALARARTAAAATGGIVSDSLAYSLADDALVPESLARSVVAAAVEEDAPDRGQGPATAGGDTGGGPATGGGGAGAAGFTGPRAEEEARKEESERGAGRGKTPGPRAPSKSASKPGTPPPAGGRAAEPAFADDAKDKGAATAPERAADAAAEILVVVFLPADVPATAPPR